MGGEFLTSRRASAPLGMTVAIRYSLFAIRYSLFAIRYSLFAIRCVVTTDC